jgi:hypothetical protein
MTGTSASLKDPLDMDDEFDDMVNDWPWCVCENEPDEEECFSNSCKCCGKPIT